MYGTFTVCRIVTWSVLLCSKYTQELLWSVLVIGTSAAQGVLLYCLPRGPLQNVSGLESRGGGQLEAVKTNPLLPCWQSWISKTLDESEFQDWDFVATLYPIRYFWHQKLWTLQSLGCCLLWAQSKIKHRLIGQILSLRRSMADFPVCLPA
jgi:hypothetical protein